MKCLLHSKSTRLFVKFIRKGHGRERWLCEWVLIFLIQASVTWFWVNILPNHFFCRYHNLWMSDVSSFCCKDGTEYLCTVCTFFQPAKWATSVGGTPCLNESCCECLGFLLRHIVSVRNGRCKLAFYDLWYQYLPVLMYSVFMTSCVLHSKTYTCIYFRVMLQFKGCDTNTATLFAYMRKLVQLCFILFLRW